MKKILEFVVAGVALLGLIAIVLSGFLYQWQILELGQAFTVLRYGAITGGVGALLVIAYLIWSRPGGIRLGVLVLCALLGATSFYVPYRQLQEGQDLPRLHDVTTDTVNPPVFVDVAPLRADAPNPAEYDGPEVAAIQLEGYPDLVTLVYQHDFSTVFEAAADAADEMGWEPVANVPAEGRIEATAVTQWFGFKDDVVIRIREDNAGGIEVDIRSKSRLGGHDWGANAGRIRAFRDLLNEKLG
jgi:hypothetical protein